MFSVQVCIYEEYLIVLVAFVDPFVVVAVIFELIHVRDARYS